MATASPRCRSGPPATCCAGAATTCLAPVEAAAILFTVLLVFLEIRHAMNGGDVYARHSGLAEIALQVAAGLAIAIGLEWLRVAPAISSIMSGR